MRTLILTVVAAFAFTSVASACDCGGYTPKQVKKIQEELLKQNADKYSRYWKCRNRGESKLSCAAEVISYMTL